MRQTLDKIATNILRFLLPALALTLPLFFLPNTTDFFQINKNLLILIAGSLSLLAWLVRNITRRRILLSLTPATIPLLLLSAVYIASSIIQSGNLYMSLMGKTATIIALTAIFVAVTSSQKNRLVIDLTFAALIVSAILVSLFSLYSYLGLTASLPLPEWFKAKTFNPVGGPIPLLSFVIPMIPLTLYLALRASRSLIKIPLLLISALFVVAALTQINLILPNSGNTIFLLPPSAGWFIAVDIFKNARTALLGVGPENFLSAFTRLKPAYLNQTPLWNSRFSASSNELFTILTTTGILGTIFWLTATLKSISGNLKQKLDKAPLLLLTASFLFTLLIPINPVLLGLVFIGLTLVNLSLKLETHLVKDVFLNLSANPYEQLTETKTTSFQLLPWLFAVILLPILGLFWFNQARAYAANLATYQAITSLNTNAVESYNQQVRAYKLEPNNPYYHLNFSQTSLALANSIASQKEVSDQDKKNITQLVEQAIREAKRATELDPNNVVIWENLAGVYRQLMNFAQGAADWTVASYGRAIELDPNNARLRFDLGGVFFALKDLDSAQRFYEQAINLKPNWPNAHYNLAVNYKEKKDYPKALAEMRIVIQLLDPNSGDYQKAQDEAKALEKLVPATTTAPATAKPEEANQNLELVTPTPLPSPKTQVDLPTGSAPELPAN